MGLAGYGPGGKPSNRVWDNLEANAVALCCGPSQIVFLQVDAISAGEELRRALLNALRGKLADEELFLVASHTHSAPGIDPRLPGLGEVRPDYVAAVTAKSRGCCERCSRRRPSAPRSATPSGKPRTR